MSFSIAAYREQEPGKGVTLFPALAFHAVLSGVAPAMALRARHMLLDAKRTVGRRHRPPVTGGKKEE